jgi:hypothetical protein
MQDASAELAHPPRLIRSDVMLATFLASNPAAKRAASALRAGAEVAITLTDVSGDQRVYLNDAGSISFEPTKAVDPDFELRIPPAAVRAICSRNDADLADLGIAFFEHIIARQQEYKIHVKVHSGVVKLTRRGWLKLLTQGGSKTLGWMAAKGLRGPGAVASALGRLRS